MSARLVFADLGRTFRSARESTVALAGDQRHARARQLHRLRRPIGLRQVDAACTSPPGSTRNSKARSRASPPTRRSLASFNSLASCLGKRRAATSRSCSRRAGSPGATRAAAPTGSSISSVSARRGDALPGAAFGRHAAARLARPRARGRSRPAADGRAVLGARRADRGAPARRAGRAVRAEGAHHPACHAQHPRSVLSWRPRRRDERRTRGRVVAEIAVDVPRPRRLDDPRLAEFAGLVRDLIDRSEPVLSPESCRLTDHTLPHGIYPYLVSPVDRDGRVDEALIERLVGDLIAAGVNGVTPLGSTGEVMYLTPTQRRAIVAATIRAARRPRAGGSRASPRSRPTTRSSRRKSSKRMGVDGLVVMRQNAFPTSEAGRDRLFRRSRAGRRRSRSCSTPIRPCSARISRPRRSSRSPPSRTSATSRTRPATPDAS